VRGRSSAEERLNRLSALCLALPQASREDKGEHAAFLVRKKIFAYYVNNHHGDNKVALWCKVLAGENKFLVDADPDRFFLPAYVASRGWVGLRMDLATVDWTEVKELIHGSYLQIAPRKLQELIRQ
jgi:hypothetical protein